MSSPRFASWWRRNGITAAHPARCTPRRPRRPRDPTSMRAAQRVVPAGARAHRSFRRRGLHQGIRRAQRPTGCPWASRPSRRAGRSARFAGGSAKPGFETFEGSGQAQNADGRRRFTLRLHGTTPEGMVRVPGGAVAGMAAGLPDFFIDKFEVTNKAFKRFVDAGGYRDRAVLAGTLSTDGRTLSRGRRPWRSSVTRPAGPGPSTWELGTYPEGQDDWPVRGVSWYEAAAYAQFAGKSLPTVHHWRLAAGLGIHSAILEWSNFSGKGPARVGEFLGIGPYGTFDMAGNVKEWCANAVRRPHATSWAAGGTSRTISISRRMRDWPFDRSDNNGLRLVTLPDPAGCSGRGLWTRRAADARLPPGETGQRRSVRRVRPAVLLRASDLKPTVETSTRASEHWRVERVSYNAAYGGERVIAYLFLPKNAPPPYQTVVYFPHAGGLAAGLIPAGRDGLPRLSGEVGASASVSDVQSHVRTTAEGATSRAQRLARHHDSASEGRRPIDRLPADAPGHRRRSARVLRRQHGRHYRADRARGRSAVQDGRPLVGRITDGRLACPKTTRSTSPRASGRPS